jgi:hypothetical protein
MLIDVGSKSCRMADFYVSEIFWQALESIEKMMVCIDSRSALNEIENIGNDKYK